jgi:N-acetyl-gamma-glutamyl-phosphate reductase
MYALSQAHKHLPEMMAVPGLNYPPVFCPVLGGFYAGMTGAVPLLPRLMNKNASLCEAHSFFSSYYENQKLVRVMPLFEPKQLRRANSVRLRAILLSLTYTSILEGFT